MRKVITIIFILFTYTSISQVTDTTYFAVNSYVKNNACNLYPQVVKSALPTASNISLMTNVLSFGAVGNGTTRDDAAIAAAFNAATYGVYFPPNKTYLVGSTRTISLTHNLVVWAYGATIKMADLTQYTFLQLDGVQGSYLYNLLWLGGTIDGNQYNQIWPGNPHGGIYDGAFVEAHGILIAFEFLQFALAKDVTVVNSVIDGMSIRGCRIAMYDNCTASGGAPLSYGTFDEQGTYFKFRSTVGVKAKWMYANNVVCTGGSIGIHVSTPTQIPPLDNTDSTTTVIYNCKFTNQRQDNIHIEDSKKVFVYGCILNRDTNYNYRGDLQISTKTHVASIRNTFIRNGKLDFRQATDLRLAIVTDCAFSSEFSDGTPDSNLLITMMGAPKVTVLRSTFIGRTIDEQNQARYIKKCTYTNFHALATRGGLVVDSCTFTNGVRPASLGSGGRFTENTMISVSNPNTNVPHIPADELPFNSVIKIYNLGGVFRGTITCN